MSGICGWINVSSGPDTEPAVIGNMAGALSYFDQSPGHILRSPNYAVAVATLARTHNIFHENGAMAAIYGDPLFTEPELTAAARHQGTAKTLIAGFRDRGLDILQAMKGPFALVVMLQAEKRALLAIDRAGICPLYYSLVDGCLVFGSTTEALNRHPRIPTELDAQALFSYLYFHMVPSPGSAYKGRKRLDPASYVHLTDERIDTGTYWKIRYSRETDRLSAGDLKQEFRELLRRSVRQTQDDRHLGTFLSGGTDSSTVAGILGDVSGDSPSTYSIGFDVPGYDELTYARLAARHFRTKHHEYYVTPADVAQAIPKIARVYAEPFGNSSALAAYYCAIKAKEDGIEKLLAGDGGDELFGGNTRYAKQYIFSLYSDIPEIVRKKVIEPLVFSLPGGEKIGPIRKLRSYIEQASVPMPARLETYNSLQRLGLANVLEPGFLASVNADDPLNNLTGVYWGSAASTTLNRMLALDLKFTLADNDLPKVSRTCELAGLDVSYPLLNEDLIDFAARLPVRLKVKGTELRYFFKEALRDFLPPEIIAKKKHGFGLPFGPWVQTDKTLRAMVSDNLMDLKKRGIVRPAFIDDLLETYLPSHPGYYGTMVWLLTMLEQWYKSHVDTRVAHDTG